MPVPPRRAEQRAAALQFAAEVRQQRAELVRQLKSGAVSLAAVLERTDDVVGKMKVAALLTALPRVGAVRAQRTMTRLEISPNRRVRGLGAGQRAALVAAFEGDSTRGQSADGPSAPSSGPPGPPDAVYGPGEIPGIGGAIDDF